MDLIEAEIKVDQWRQKKLLCEAELQAFEEFNQDFAIFRIRRKCSGILIAIPKGRRNPSDALSGIILFSGKRGSFMRAFKLFI